jgi:hypothetical protein
MTKTVYGIAHGKTIELNEDLGVPEGQAVEITVHTVNSASARKEGEGFLRTEGALADDSEWDAIMQEVYLSRKYESRRQTIPELEQ